MSKREPPQGLNRRRFLAGGALLGTGAILPAVARAESAGAILRSERPDGPYDLGQTSSTIHSACLQCNTGCGIKCKLQDGVLTKIDGNPYSPWTLLPHLDYATPLEVAQPVDGSICPKGQAGLQTAYDPYRIRKVLKRAGRRGENRWLAIPFEQAVRELCDGGRLFSHVPGEERRQVAGLRELTPLRDAAVAKAMATDVEAIWKEKNREKKAGLVAAFRERHAAHLQVLIDPEHPDLGPKNNQIVVAWGRIKGGRGELYKRFAAALGTVNAHGHTTVCQGSLYFAGKALSNSYEGGKFGGGDKFYWQANTEHSRFVLFVGANLFEANYGPPNRALRLTDNLASGKTRIAVADPRFSKLASKAWKWLPVRPGTDAALAMAVLRWMLDEGRYDRTFLAAANRAAAERSGEKSWTNASWLVAIDQGEPRGFVRAADVRVPPGKVTSRGEPNRTSAGKAEASSQSDGSDGLVPLAAPEERILADGKAYVEKRLVVLVDGEPVAFEPNDAKSPVNGDLLVDTTLPDGTAVKSALQLIAEEARRYSIEEWCAIAGVAASDVVDVARELASHGKRAAVDIHRGVAQHTNGFYNVLAWMTVNALLGNYDHSGGMCKASTYDFTGKGKLFDLKKHPGVVPSFGVSSIRHGLDYEKTTLFSGYPAKRNWYPLASDVYEEIVPSIGDRYPYPIKALFLYMGAPTYALPAGHTNIPVLADVEQLPLFVASDVLVGTTSVYADYVFPDLSYLERWELQGSHPNVAQKVQPVRQPVIAPVPEPCTTYGQKMPICLESMLFGIAEQLGLPGFGKDGLGPGLDLKHLDDYYLRAIANLAWGEKPDGSQAVPDADAAEVTAFEAARRHLPPEVYDVERWRRIAGPKSWRKAVLVLNRGGRFEAAREPGPDGLLPHPYAAFLNLYQEKTAGTVHSGTGKRLRGHAVYLPVQDFHGEEPTAMRAGHDFVLVTHRTISQTKSRTIVDPWLSPVMPENAMLVNPVDAARLGITHGQLVRVVSATNRQGVWPLAGQSSKPMVGKAWVTETIRPGVTSFALGFGHWATGAADLVVDDHHIVGEPRRAAGIHANAAMWVDPTLGNTCFVDPVGGSVSFYDTHVRLVPV